MAHMSQEMKKSLAPVINAILKKYGMKGTLAVNNHSTLVLNLKEGPIDFGRDYCQVNPYWYHEHYSGVAKDFLSEIIPAMNIGNWNRSDIMTDYFDVGWYVDVNIGKWNKSYVCTNKVVDMVA
jgi:hypothetical protein